MYFEYKIWLPICHCGFHSGSAQLRWVMYQKLCKISQVVCPTTALSACAQSAKVCSLWSIVSLQLLSGSYSPVYGVQNLLWCPFGHTCCCSGHSLSPIAVELHVICSSHMLTCKAVNDVWGGTTAMNNKCLVSHSMCLHYFFLTTEKKQKRHKLPHQEQKSRLNNNLMPSRPSSVSYPCGVAESADSPSYGPRTLGLVCLAYLGAHPTSDTACQWQYSSRGESF